MLTHYTQLKTATMLIGQLAGFGKVILAQYVLMMNSEQEIAVPILRSKISADI